MPKPPSQPLSASVADCLDQATRLLQAAAIDNARLDAEVLLAEASGQTRTWLYTWSERQLGADVVERFLALVEKRRARMPLAYVVGYRDFYALRLRVSSATLIPRPETELLVDEALHFLRSLQTSPRQTLPPASAATTFWEAQAQTVEDLRRAPYQAKVLDLCTGSGAVALALAAHAPPCSLLGSDISPDALAMARSNALTLGLHEKIDWRCGDLFNVLTEGETFDLITANPPYIAPEDMAGLEPEVRDHEPHMALSTEDEGYAVLTRILQGAVTRLVPGGLLGMEIGADQGPRALDMAASLGYLSVQIKQDWSGRDRLLWAQWGRAASHEA